MKPLQRILQYPRKHLFAEVTGHGDGMLPDYDLITVYHINLIQINKVGFVYLQEESFGERFYHMLHGGAHQ